MLKIKSVTLGNLPVHGFLAPYQFVNKPVAPLLYKAARDLVLRVDGP